MPHKDSSEYIKDLESRLAQQEEINRFTLDALELAVTLIDFQPNYNQLESSQPILEETCSRIKRLIDFHALGIYLVDEQDNDFYPAYVTPEEYRDLLFRETDRLIEQGLFPWAMREKRAVNVPGTIQGLHNVLHVISTNNRVRGMFIGLIGQEASTVPDVSWALLSIVLSSSANALESFELYKMFKDSNIHLKQVVKERTKQLELQARYDRLTHLPNRDMIFKSLEKKIRACLESDHCAQVAFILVDMDMFKEVNDTLGHQAGDNLLVQVGFRLQEIIHEPENLGRLGGDEFAMLLCANNAKEQAEKKAKQVLRVMSQPFEIQGQSLLLDVSIGIAIFPEHGKNLGQILSRADMAMYAAKRMKTGYAVYDPEFESSGINRLNLMSDLKRALDKDQLTLYFQPKIELSTEQVCGLEALLRWHHPSRGFIPPDEFIPLAEQIGLIRKLTDRVIHLAAAHIKHWQTLGINLTLGVNISARDIQDARLVQQIDTTLSSFGVPNSSLELEITENAFMSAPHAGLRTLQKLHSMNIPVGIDDFGTGYSSISYLRDLPVQILKIDRSFVMDIKDNPNNQKIVKSIIDLGHNLDMQVVAEGVENREGLDLLKRMRCDMAQGYYFLKPKPAEELTDWLQSRMNIASLRKSFRD